VSRYFLDERVFSIFEGAEEVLALKVVARQVLQRLLDEKKAKTTEGKAKTTEG
jgi:(2S)-methylsuccinyl-CoA dehydrogenase